VIMTRKCVSSHVHLYRIPSQPWRPVGTWVSLIRARCICTQSWNICIWPKQNLLFSEDVTQQRSCLTVWFQKLIMWDIWTL
jgi:hypothetical protein